MTIYLPISNRLLSHFISIVLLFTSSLALLVRFGTTGDVYWFGVNYCQFLDCTLFFLIYLYKKLHYKLAENSQLSAMQNVVQQNSTTAV